MSASSLLSFAEFGKRYDTRPLADLFSVNDKPVNSLSSNAGMTAALNGASHEVEGALVASGRYTAAGLAALTGTAQAALFDLIAPFVLVHAYRFRPERRPLNFQETVNVARADLFAYCMGDKTLE